MRERNRLAASTDVFQCDVYETSYRCMDHPPSAERGGGAWHQEMPSGQAPASAKHYMISHYMLHIPIPLEYFELVRVPNTVILQSFFSSFAN